MAFLFYTYLRLPLLKKAIMSTVTRSTNGSVKVVNGSNTEWIVGLSNVRVKKDGDNTIKLINFQDQQTILSLTYSDITEINGDAAPGTIDEAVDLLGSEVFFSSAGGGTGSGGSTTIDFTESVPFSYNQAVMNKTIIAPLEFVPDPTGRKAGNSVLLRIVADGVNIPVFTGFQKLVSSDDFDNTAGRVHIISFIFNGRDYNYTISEAQIVDPVQPLALDFEAVDANTILVTFNKPVLGTAVGWTFKRNGNVIVPSELAGSGSTVFTFTFDDTLLSTDVLLASYNSFTGDIVDLSGNAMDSFTDESITNEIDLYIFSDNFISEDTANIAGRVTPIGAKTWLEMVDGKEHLSIVDNTLKSLVGSPGNHYGIDIGKTDTELTARVSALKGGGAGLYLLVISNNTLNYTQIKLDNLQVVQYSENLEGGFSILSDGSGTTTVGQRVKAVVAGTSLSLYRNDVLVFSVILDLTNAGTQVGIFSYSDADSSVDLLRAS